jgi:hypothetical protein
MPLACACGSLGGRVPLLFRGRRAEHGVNRAYDIGRSALADALDCATATAPPDIAAVLSASPTAREPAAGRSLPT